MHLRIGRYELRGELGRGGMGSVYRAFDPSFKREVALKVLPREYLHDPEFRARFQREAEIIARLEHPAIVPVYDYGEEGGQPYIVMRLMSGGTLAECLTRGPLSLAETGQVLARIAPALDKAHSLGIIHRDLKPANVLFDDEYHPYISDFGLAKMRDRGTQLSSNQIMGTPAYMSPEQVRGEKTVDGRADLYALGVIVFQMLTGKVPFDAETPVGVAVKHITDPPPKLSDTRPDLPKVLDSVIERALAKDPEQRYPNASKLVQDVQAATQGRPLQPRIAAPLAANIARPPTHPAPALPASTPPARAAQGGMGWRRPLPWLLGCGALVVVATIGLTSMGALGLFLSRSPGSPTTPTQATGADDELPFALLRSSSSMMQSLAIAAPTGGSGSLLLVSYQDFNAPDSKRARTIAAISAESGELLWRSTFLETGDTDPILVSSGSVVVTFDGADAVGVSLLDGRLAWRITLQDVGVDLRPLGDQLVALAADGTVTGIAPEFGGILWNETVLEGEAGSLIPLGTRLAVADNDGDDDFFRVFSPDGSSIEWRPSCVERGTSYNTSYGPWLRPIAESQVVAVVFSYDQTCVQRVNLDTLEEIWTERLAVDQFKISASIYNPRIVTSADWIMYPNPSDDVVGLRASDGTASVLAADDEYALAPITAAGDLIIVSATEDRGTSSAEAWAIDAATGDRRWQLSLGESVPFDQPASWLWTLSDDEVPVWLTRLFADQILIFAFAGSSSSATVETYRGPLAEGPASEPVKSDLGPTEIPLRPPLMVADGDRGSWVLFNGRLWHINYTTGKAMPVGR